MAILLVASRTTLRTSHPSIRVQSRTLFGFGGKAKNRKAELNEAVSKLGVVQKEIKDIQSKDNSQLQMTTEMVQRSYGSKRKGMRRDVNMGKTIADYESVNLAQVALANIPTRKWIPPNTPMTQLFSLWRLRLVTAFVSWRTAFTYIRPAYTDSWREDLLTVSDEVYDQLYRYISDGKPIDHPSTSISFRRNPDGENSKKNTTKKLATKKAGKEPEPTKYKLIRKLHKPVIAALAPLEAPELDGPASNEKPLPQVQLAVRFESEIEKRKRGTSTVSVVEECLIFRVDLPEYGFMDAYRAGPSVFSPQNYVPSFILNWFSKPPIPSKFQTQEQKPAKLAVVDNFNDFKVIRKMTLESTAPKSEVELINFQIDSQLEMKQNAEEARERHNHLRKASGMSSSDTAFMSRSLPSRR